MGVPQYRWREIPQSFSRNCTVRWPIARRSALAAMMSMASVDQRPSYSPDATTLPGSSLAAVIVAASSGTAPSPSGCITTRIGSEYFLANSKSRWSCAGTAITAPVPYSPSTKLATQMGTCSPVNGLIASRPVLNPSFSTSPVRRALRSCLLNLLFASRNASGSADSAAMRSTSSCSGASRTKVAPKMVSIRVVKTSMSPAPPAPDRSTRGNLTRAPTERPIQFRCMVRTFSGHSFRPSIACSSSSAKCVIRRNHCSRSRLSTSVPQRQHPPSTTCSLARTV